MCPECPDGAEVTVREYRDATIAEARVERPDWVPSAMMEAAYAIGGAILGWDTRHTADHIEQATRDFVERLLPPPQVKPPPPQVDKEREAEQRLLRALKAAGSRHDDACQCDRL